MSFIPSRIITNKNVDVDFDGNPCRLRRTITNVHTRNNKKYYHILTERVRLNENKPIFVDKVEIDGFGNEIITQEVKYINFVEVIDQKDRVQIKSIGKEEYNLSYQAIKLTVPFTDDDLWEFEKKLQDMALLVLTKASTVFNTGNDDWEFENEYLDRINSEIQE
ncbi:hypothetical protein BPT24_137 [Tenacibaculum phage pT24]|uniref:Uncharacterized protein n=1 Tax=Tenacibaculum phage pT24 TaxID=1880590 RepID=A0A1B4XWR8_9CAUD|nr:hypothetical protein HYP10_gp137 [Tenacibaculum phage pT24]BAV39262.1 hypothetical protein BPT24_137 [Tenacibaculum phage pT24]